MTNTPGKSTETLLLVDDEPAIRRLVHRGLTAKGFTVLEAADAKEALELAKRHTGKIDLVISDVVMPDMDGRQLFHELRQSQPAIRFLFMSGQVGEAVADVSVDGRTAFLPKPFSIDALLTFVRHVLDGDQRAP